VVPQTAASARRLCSRSRLPCPRSGAFRAPRFRAPPSSPRSDAPARAYVATAHAARSGAETGERRQNRHDAPRAAPTRQVSPPPPRAQDIPACVCITCIHLQTRTGAHRRARMCLCAAPCDCASVGEELHACCPCGLLKCRDSGLQPATAAPALTGEGHARCDAGFPTTVCPPSNCPPNSSISSSTSATSSFWSLASSLRRLTNRDRIKELNNLNRKE